MGHFRVLGLNRLASLGCPLREESACGRTRIADLPGHDPDWPFECETGDVLAAIEGGQSELVAQYPPELAKLVVLLGDMLDPEGRGEFQLKPVRRRKGRPANKKRDLVEGSIYRDLKFARARLGGKLEAAISEVTKSYGINRSTALRIWGKHKRT